MVLISSQNGGLSVVRNITTMAVRNVTTIRGEKYHHDGGENCNHRLRHRSGTENSLYTYEDSCLFIT